MTDGGGTPAGWYPDPWQPGAQRYYDGQAWTQHAHGGYDVYGGAPVRAMDGFDGQKGASASSRAAIGFAVQGFAAATTALLYPLAFRWWTFYLAALVLLVPTAVLSFTGATGVALALALVVAGLHVGAMATAIAITKVVQDDQAAAARAQGRS